MSDDAEFDAFLKGEGELSRRLQAMSHTEPSAELDAAILNRARLAMAQEAHPAAANDPATEPATPRLAPPFGYRWRVPVGIAATLLAGVFATQAFQQHAKQEEAAIPDLVQPTPVMVTPVEEKAAMPEMQVPSAAPMADSARGNAALPPAKVVTPVPAEPVAAGKPMAMAPPPPPPAPVMEAAPAAAAPAPAPAAPAAPAPAPASPAPAPAPAPAMGGLVAPETARAKVAASLAADADKRQAFAPAERTERVSVTGSRIKTPDSKSWLAEIERLLKEGDNEQALHEWQGFRAAYPRLKVAPELEAKLDALEK